MHSLLQGVGRTTARRCVVRCSNHKDESFETYQNAINKHSQTNTPSEARVQVGNVDLQRSSARVASLGRHAAALTLHRIVSPATTAWKQCCGHTMIVVKPWQPRPQEGSIVSPQQYTICSISACGRTVQAANRGARCKKHYGAKTFEIWTVPQYAMDAEDVELLFSCNTVKQLANFFGVDTLEFQNHWGKFGVSFDDLLVTKELTKEQPVAGNSDMTPWSRCGPLAHGHMGCMPEAQWSAWQLHGASSM